MSEAEIARATAAQLAAARPDMSSWVTANAGSGKTSVLTNRVARVLLNGTPPARILCLTYTKAAAAEMQNRLFAQLGHWSMLADEALGKALRDLGVTAHSPAFLADARRLFARALETPGGLKIQTIHAFCESLLRRFPLEAGLSPNFDLLDDHASAQLRATVLDDMAEGDDAEAFTALATISGQIDTLLPAILRHQDLFAAPSNPKALATALGIAPDLSDDDILHAAMQGLSDADIDWLASQLAIGGATEVTAATALGTMRIVDASKALDLFIGSFLTNAGTRYKRGFPGAKTKDIAGLAPLLDQFCDRAIDAFNTRKNLAALNRSLVLHNFAHAFLARYHAAKMRRQRLDFDDLIRNASALLNQSDMAAWVLFRLDGGIDHILIDEAQDTSPAQWRIFTKLADEILAGEGARIEQRTLFVVGDVKQSIFSFQGADPAGFTSIEAEFAARLAERETPLQQASLLHSFRSATPILSLVDAVFADVAAGLGQGTKHVPAFPDRPGRVDLWPFTEREDTPPKLPIFDLTPAAARPDAERELGRQIARKVAQLLATNTPLPGAGRAVRPGDILILVRRRKELYKSLIRALKSEKVAVAGADRLTLTDELAVRDLLAALRFAASPADDLSLAAVLRSPLIGWTEGQLFTLAHGRKGALWPALLAAGAPPVLKALRDQADFQRPFALLELILQDFGGRAALLARLGAECEDAVDELLNQALAYETSAIPTLSGFLDWIDSGEVEIKRQVDEASDQLRVMSVHGAKGLEAPIVILPDTAARKAPNETHILQLAPNAISWGHGADNNPALVQDAADAARQRRSDEELRLLYVAMTRAKTWLIVTGAGNIGTENTPSWYGRIAAALQEFPNLLPSPDGGLSLLHNWGDLGEPDAQSRVTIREATSSAPPAWFSDAVPTPTRPAAPIAPSGLGGAHALTGDAGQDTATALAYGAAVHDLLEEIVGLEGAAQSTRLAELDADIPERAEIAALLASPDMQEILAAAPMAEVGFVANIAGLGTIEGRIDLLSITPDCITAYDFKTNRTVPSQPDETPEALLRQMGAYRAALRQIYPDRQINCAIIWTRSAKVMQLDAKLTDQALERAIAARAIP